MARKAKDEDKQLVGIQELQLGTVVIHILGKSPLVMNRLPKKAREELLLPKRRENIAQRQAKLKHDPVAEFRDSVYRCRTNDAPTLIHLPDNAFKKAMAQAALDIPGATKAEIGRLVQVIDPTVYLYGKPYLYMAIVRQAGINRTPDVRTRAYFWQWACKITVQYIRSRIREQDVANLAAAAGIITGVGDGRAEKGTFNFGSWEVVGADDKRWRDIVKTQGRAVQESALLNPEAIDADSEELLAWFGEEVIRREATDQIAKTGATPNGRGRRARKPKQQPEAAA